MTRTWTDLARCLRGTAAQCTWRTLRWGLALMLALTAPFATHALQTVNGITIDENLPQARRGVAYTHTVPVSGGTAPHSFALIGASTLPIRLTLAANGQLTGVISCSVSNGSYRQDVRVTDSSAVPIVADFTGNRGLAVNVTAGPAGTCVTLTLTPASLPAPTAGSAYSQTITASGGLGPYSYAVTAGTLPAGLTLNTSTGAITGTPTTGGAYGFTVTATDAADSTGSMAYSGTVIAPIVVNPASLPGGTVGSAYSQTVTATGGTGTKTLSLTGSLPAGLTFTAATGVISGTPTTAGTSNFTITATDTSSATGSRAYSITVGTPVSVGPASLPAGTVGNAYSQSVTASGGTGPYTYAVTSGPLPAGLSLNTGSGAITGTPTASGTSIFSITATDSNGASGLRAYTVTINPAITVNPSSLPTGTAGTAYSQSLSATGGNGSFTYAVTAGALPAGVTLNTSSGLVSGTPGSAGTSNFTVTATDGNGATGSRSYALTVNAAIAVNPASLANGTVGTAYTQTVSATGGNGSYTYSISPGALPAGLTLNATSGAISGTPTTPGTSSFTILATDGTGATGARAYSVTVAAAPIVVSPATLPGATIGAAYSQTVTASGGAGGFTYSISAGTLPAGLTLNAASGIISGTPTTAGASSFTVRATDSGGGSGTRAYSVTTSAAIVVNPASLPGSTVGTAYSRTISATGGTGAKTFSVSAGTLPTGLALNATTGVISGTPTSAGTYGFTIRATDTVGATGTRAYSVTINPAIIVNPATLPGGTRGTTYSQTVSASGGTGSFTYSVSVGSLPAGLTLNAATGAISGTPTTAQTRTFTIRATDGNGAFGSRAYSVTIAAAIVVNPTSLPGGSVGSAYSRTVSATGGTGTKTFSVSVGALPAGLTLNTSTGVISGTPTSAGPGSFTIAATDSIGAIGTRAYTITINPGISVSPSSLPNGTSGTAYSRTISASGGTGSYTFSVSAGSLGGGLALNATTGVISGTPTTTGVRNFTIRATDGNGSSGSRAYTITINAAITLSPTTLANGTVGTAYSRTVTASGGTGAGTYTYSVSAGTLPAGLTLNASTGVISGTPTATGSSSFTIRATDTLGAIGSRAYTVTIAAAPVVVNPATLPGGAVGSPYNQSVGATGGTGTYTFSVSAGSLPAGLTLNASTGAIAGTPTTAGPRTFTIRATDTASASGTRSYTVTINAAVVVNPVTLAGGTAGTAYSQTLTATGGSGGYTFGVSVGTLPAGLTLNATTGVLSGTPVAGGTSSFTVRATDSNGASGTRAYSVTIAAAPIVVNPATLPGGQIGSAYSQIVSASGGTGSFSYSISAGTLPAGLALNASSGAVTGTPTATGTSTFTVRATDSGGSSGTRAYTVTITPAPIVVNPAALPGGTVGSAYAQTVSATGGTGSYTFSVSAGALPAGLTLNASTGAIAGTPMAFGSSSFSVTATDGSGATGTRAYSVVVAPAPIVVSPASLPVGTAGSAYAQTVTATGGTGGYTFAISAGALPAGLSLNATSGAISGTPTAAGSSNFTITATDSSGGTGARAYTLPTNAAIVVNPASLPVATVGSAYSQTVVAAGGSGSYTYAVSAGTLPAGLALNPATGAITGTPTATTASTFTITATDGSGATGARSYTMTPNAGVAVNPPTLPPAAVGAMYSQSVTATGGTGTFNYSITGGSLPAGLTLNGATGLISGTPTTPSTTAFTVTATDGNGISAARAYSFTVNAAMTLNPVTLSNGIVGVAYAQTASAAGGNGSYAYSVSDGTLPAGLALNASTGAITGTPTTAAVSSFTVSAVDGTGVSASRAYTVTISPALALDPPTLPNPTVGTAYAQTVAATGGSGSYTFSITAGTLPAGLTLNASTGAISGTPTAAGPGTFTVTVTDGAGSSASRAYAVDVAPSALVLESTTLGNGVVGTPYNQAIVVSGGTAPYAFTLAAGVLPAGVTLNASTGALVGTPTTAGTYAFTVRVVDASGASATFAQSIVVEPRPDPSADPTVRGILASQISAASRFGSAQVDNVGARVRMLHLGQDPCSLQFDVSTNVRWERAPGSADDAKPDSAQAAKPDDKSGERRRCDSRFAFWAAGNVDFGFLRPNSATRRSDFTTSGLTVGADTRVLPGLVLGAALGYGRDVTDVGTDGSESRAQGASATVYGSYEPLKSLYVDFALGYGGLDFDSTRWNSSSALTGGRSGSQTFGSIGLSTVIDVGGLKFAPYGRFDSVRNRLDAYTESGPVTMALGYADVKATDNALAAGLFASARIPLGGASLEPALRFELRRVRGSSADQSLWYADLPMTTYSITDGTVSDTQLVGGAGLVLRVRDALSVGLDYSYGGSSGVYRNESLRLLLRAPF